MMRGFLRLAEFVQQFVQVVSASCALLILSIH
jgi:hypothetical protein